MKSNLSKITYFVLAILIGLTQPSEAQDGPILRSLEVNQILLVNAEKSPLRKSETRLELPFFDDFSSLHSPFPNPEKWQDRYVFINATFPLFPPTIGVATFDALDENGRLYEHAASYPFGADTLTSQPFRLDSILVGTNRRNLYDASLEGDTVFFSFYYQPGGGFDGLLRGVQPRRNDWLILEFRNGLVPSIESTWIEVWSTRDSLDDYSLETFCPQCPDPNIPDKDKNFFKQVVIPITDQTYLYNGFQFRFRNLSSLDQNQSQNQQSAGGQWHIDYVHIDLYSGGFTPVVSDVAFVEQGQRVLKDFQAMPYKQFRGASDLVTEIPLLIRNLDNITHSISYNFQITGPPPYLPWDTTTIAQIDILPFNTNGFNFGADIYEPQRNFRIPQTTSPSTFKLQHVLRSNRMDVNETNDTMIQIVHFDNYYAYDDGSSEAGFGFSRERDRSLSQFAYRFPMREKDTLIGVQIWFNYTFRDMSRAYFDLAFWTAIDDTTPSQDPILVSDLLPEYSETIGFSEYWFNDPILLDTGSFFIGFQQRNTAYLNIGFDQNNNVEKRMFYNVGNEWLPVLYYGAVMVRPVFGTRTATRICERDQIFNDIERIKVFPNPSSDGLIFVESPETVVNSYEIYDINGRKLLQRAVRNTQFSINLPKQSGIYILVLHTENGVVSKKVVRR
jgi:hypothetical protein